MQAYANLAKWKEDSEFDKKDFSEETILAYFDHLQGNKKQIMMVIMFYNKNKLYSSYIQSELSQSHLLDVKNCY